MAQYFKDMLEERENSERIRERRRSARIPRATVRGEEPLDDPITIRAPHTSIVIDAPADRQCQLCGWYFAVGRSPETIRHFTQCPLFNPHGVDE